MIFIVLRYLGVLWGLKLEMGLFIDEMSVFIIVLLLKRFVNVFCLNFFDFVGGVGLFGLVLLGMLKVIF